jgi:hypothetical protein
MEEAGAPVARCGQSPSLERKGLVRAQGREAQGSSVTYPTHLSAGLSEE